MILHSCPFVTFVALLPFPRTSQSGISIATRPGVRDDALPEEVEANVAGTALIVEDETELAELFAEILRLRGLNAHIFHVGSPAPQWVREHRPDLVLLDLM